MINVLKQTVEAFPKSTACKWGVEMKFNMKGKKRGKVRGKMRGKVKGRMRARDKPLSVSVKVLRCQLEWSGVV